MAYQWNFEPVWRSLDLLALGGLATLKLTGACLLLAIPVGLLVAVLRLSSHKFLSGLALVYTEFFRTAASIVLIFWFFFAFPLLISVDLDAFWAAMLAIGLQGGAYFAEVFRGAIVSIHKGQIEAAKAIGMNRFTALRFVILPQAIRRIIPVLFTRTTLLLKTTTLASAIAYPDIVYTAFRISSETYRPIETFTIVGAMFFIAIFTLARLAGWAERRLALPR